MDLMWLRLWLAREVALTAQHAQHAEQLQQRDGGDGAPSGAPLHGAHSGGERDSGAASEPSQHYAADEVVEIFFFAFGGNALMGLCRDLDIHWFRRGKEELWVAARCDGALLALDDAELACFVRGLKTLVVRSGSQCCTVLCCAVLCCAVLCCAVLCCAVLSGGEGAGCVGEFVHGVLHAS